MADAAAIVDTALPQQERAFVQHAASVLRVGTGPHGETLKPENFQIAVLDGTTGKMYFNRADLRGTMRAVRSRRHFDPRPQAVSTGVALQQGRRPLVYNGKPFPDAGSGPYRRIYTPPNRDPQGKGIGSIQSAVTTGCNAGNTYNFTAAAQQNHGLIEDGNLLLGGWSRQNNAVDAGLMYNKGIQAGSQDDYSPIFAISNIGNGPIEFDHSSGTKVNWHIPCNGDPLGGPTTTMTFYADQPTGQFGAPNYPGNQVELVSQYQYYDVNVQQQRQIDLIFVSNQTGDWNGWNPACDQCVFKRETTIAQKSAASGGKPDTFNNGDSFRAAWWSTKLTCGFLPDGCTDTNGQHQFFDMTNFMIKACEEYPAWTDYHDDVRDCNNTPPIANNHIQVSAFNYNSEMDVIDLHPDASTPPQNPVPFPTPMGQSFYFQPVFNVASDGLHVGMNISNDGNSSGPPVTKNYEWSRNSPYRFIIYQYSPYQVVFDSWAGQRFTSSLYWETWAPNETKHVEAVWPGYSANTTYYFGFTSYPMNDLGANITSQTFIPGDVDRAAEPSISGDTPVYPEGTPTPAPTPDPTPTDPPPPPDGGGGCGRPPCPILYGARTRLSPRGEQSTPAPTASPHR